MEPGNEGTRNCIRFDVKTAASGSERSGSYAVMKIGLKFILDDTNGTNYLRQLT